jgi:hypothetical protein
MAGCRRAAGLNRFQKFFSFAAPVLDMGGLLIDSPWSIMGLSSQVDTPLFDPVRDLSDPWRCLLAVL